jgi:hypothetical protein
VGSIGYCSLYTGGELEQPQGIGNRSTALADPSADLVVGVVEFVDELLIRRCLLKGIQILSMKIFHKRLLQAVDIGGCLNQDGHTLQTRAARSAPPTLPGDELKFTGTDLPDKGRLEDPKLTYGSRQGRHRFLVESRSRLQWVRPNAGERHLSERRRRRPPRRLCRNEGSQPSTQPATPRHH